MNRLWSEPYKGYMDFNKWWKENHGQAIAGTAKLHAMTPHYLRYSVILFDTPISTVRLLAIAPRDPMVLRHPTDPGIALPIIQTDDPEELTRWWIDIVHKEAIQREAT